MYLGERLQNRLMNEYEELNSSNTKSIPSVVQEEDEKYINLPTWIQHVQSSFGQKIKGEIINKDSQNNIISVVGCLENDLGKRLMLTVQPHESIIHLSNYIGQSMQKYRMFQNLLALRATEINVVYQRKKKI